jgi:hypothetical protein
MPHTFENLLKEFPSRRNYIMKANRFVVVGVILSVIMSAAALAWQTKENAPFAGFFRPLATL